MDLVNNLLRRFKTICRGAGAGIYTLHDLHRSCITNWARHLPIFVVQQLAGHSGIRTIQRYYLLVQQQDLRSVRAVQSSLLRPIHIADLDYQKLTKRRYKHKFPSQARRANNYKSFLNKHLRKQKGIGFCKYLNRKHLR